VIADGPPRRVLEVVRDGAAALILPVPAVAELTRVLRDKLGLDPAAVGTIVALIEEVATVRAEVPERIDALSGDPDDDRIIAAAVNAGAEVLVSGDRRHVLPLGRVGTMRIVRPQELLAELGE
jgi:uncharacterized protein